MGLARFRFAGARAVVTGAAGGIGEQLAIELATRGADLVLVDRNGDGLQRLVERLRVSCPGTTSHPVVADLVDPDGIQRVVEAVHGQWPALDLLVNNAGVAMAGMFADLTADEFDWVLRINLQAPIALCRGLLPALLRADGAHIVNVSSLFGLLAPPGNSAYVTSKFGLRGFTEALHAELVPVGVGVTSVHPGGVRTRIAETARVGVHVSASEAAHGKAQFSKVLRYPADKAARRILDAVERRRGRVLIAGSAHALDLLARASPAASRALMRRLPTGPGRAAD